MVPTKCRIFKNQYIIIYVASSYFASFIDTTLTLWYLFQEYNIFIIKLFFLLLQIRWKQCILHYFERQRENMIFKWLLCVWIEKLHSLCYIYIVLGLTTTTALIDMLKMWQYYHWTLYCTMSHSCTWIDL